MLVGKTLENARIEVLEEWEQDELRRHRRRFQQRKEAELMETQRVEAARKRRTDETERRNLQQRTVKNQRVWAERKMVAREIAKDYMKFFRRDTYRELEDQGALRHPRTFSMFSHFIPSLYRQVQAELERGNEFNETTDGLLSTNMRTCSKDHKDALGEHYQKREDKKREEFRILKEKEEEKRRRRMERAAERER